MGSDISVTFTSEQAELIRAFQKQNREILKNQQALRKMGQAGGRAGKQVGGGLNDVATAAKRTALLVGTISAAILGAIRHQRELTAAAEKTFIAHDKSARALRIQGGLTALQSEAGQKRAAKLAETSGVDQSLINRISTEATSQGFASPLQTGVVDAVVAFLQSSNVDLANADLEGIVAGAAKQLTAGGKQLKAKPLLDQLVRVRGAFQETPLQALQLPDLAKAKGIATKAQVSDKDFLSSASILLGQQGSAEASTGLGNLITRLATGASDKKFSATLQGAGLKPEDVDLVGETLPEALQKLGKALKELPQKDKIPFLANLFGREKTNLQSAQALIQGAQRGEFKRIGKLQEDTAGFQAGVNVARTGPGAAIGKLDAKFAEQQKRRVAINGNIPDEVLARAIAIRDEAELNDLRQLGPAKTAPVGPFNRPRNEAVNVERITDFFKSKFQYLFGPQAVADEGDIALARRSQQESGFSFANLQKSIDANTQAVNAANKGPAAATSTNGPIGPNRPIKVQVTNNQNAARTPVRGASAGLSRRP